METVLYLIKTSIKCYNVVLSGFHEISHIERYRTYDSYLGNHQIEAKMR
jgi:hypothetical protein